MKLSIIVLAVSLLSAPFAHAKMEAVTDKAQIYAYHVAVKQAVASAARYECTNGETYASSSVADRIYQGDAAWVDNSGAQPALILGRTVNSQSREVVNVTTSADYKSILKLSIQTENLVDTDIGANLLEPKIVKKWTVVSVALSCAPFETK